MEALPNDLHLVFPPYDRTEAATRARVGDSRRVLGGLLLLRADTRRPTVDRLLDWAPRLRVTYPWLALVLVVDRHAASEDLEIARLAGSLQVRAVLNHGDSLVEGLRDILTKLEYFTLALPGWLQCRCASADPRAIHLAASLIRWGMRRSRLPAALRATVAHEHTARIWLRRAHLPTPGRLVALGGLVPVLLDLQNRRGHTISAILASHPPWTPKSFAHRVRRLVGVPPTSIAETLGWEGWADAFLLHSLGSPHPARIVRSKVTPLT